MSTKLRIKSKMLEIIQDIIEGHNLGEKIARQKLGTTPRSIVVNSISSVVKLGRTGVLLLRVKFNSEEGAFEGSLAIKEFKDESEAKRLVEINNWLIHRIQNNPRVNVPQIFSAGGKNIIYEGVDGSSYEESPIQTNLKLKLAGNAIATFHQFNKNPVNEYRYQALLDKLVKELPISEDRKLKLLSFGQVFLEMYNKNFSGVISYGDFHPGNIMISSDGETSHLIDPEFIESEAAADRFEDVSNFFVFDAYMEFLNNESLSKTFEQLTIFLDAYDSYLQHYDVNLHQIYEGTQWLSLIFHLGLIALMKGTVAVNSMKSINDFDVIESSESTDIEEIIQSYRLCREIWFMGVRYLPENTIPRTLVQQPVQDGYLITWQLISITMIDILKHDEHFGLIFKFPKKIEEISIEAGIELYKLKDKKELQNKVQELQELLGFEILIVNKNTLKITNEWESKLNIDPKTKNFKATANSLYSIWRKNPINMLVTVVNSFQNLTLTELESSAVFEKKDLKNIINEAQKKKLVTVANESIILSGNWRFILNIPYYIDLTFFD